MKKQLFFTALFMCFMFVSFGQVKIGVGAAYFDEIGVQARAGFEKDDKISIVGKVGFYFVSDITLMEFGADGHYDFMVVAENPLYLLGGLSIFRDSSEGTSSTTLRLNAGAGMTFDKIFVEVRVGIALDDGEGTEFGLTAGYNF